MKKQSLRVLTIFCGALVSGSFAWAQTTSGACSDQILRGDYGFTIEGIALPAPGVALPIRGIAMTNFDGDGKLSQVDHVIVNGVPPVLESSR